jgi:hypothetical protein
MAASVSQLQIHVRIQMNSGCKAVPGVHTCNLKDSHAFSCGSASLAATKQHLELNNMPTCHRWHPCILSTYTWHAQNKPSMILHAALLSTGPPPPHTQGFSRGSSTYRGVTAHPSGRWESRIGIPGSKHVYLGLFNQEAAAAQVGTAQHMHSVAQRLRLRRHN